MPADVNQIRAWLYKAQKRGAKYLIIGHDGFDMGDYPIYVMPSDEFWKKCPPRYGASGISSTAHEVYDLNIDIELQLSEVMAWHPPQRD